MRAWLDEEGERLWRRLHAMAAVPMDAVSADEVEALGLAVFAWQRGRNPVLARVAEATLGAGSPGTLAEVPALPTDVFKAARVACFPDGATRRVFETSGTTLDVRGRHPFADLSLYAAACEAAAARWLLPAPAYRCVLLAEPEALAPASSLSFMLARFAARWHRGESDPWMVRGAALDDAAAAAALTEACRDGVAVALLGTSFGFVHLLDAVGGARWRLPPGSVAMPTGGFKGRSREVEPARLRALVGAAFGLGDEAMLGEYGMTELSSQAYEARREGRESYRAPPWMRVSMVDPTTLRELPRGEVGLVRVVDLMNLGSAVAIQTSDLGRMDADGDGFVVLGRAPGATPRGCARAMDAALSRG
ncbi:MAG: Long-chain-fatty-acid--luciferin-component ligase [Myxococcaceae bacterium]|nr:Long-chain-fatty-acid--luciferin-component ligase [Myxococcaceae bacterium]